MSGNDSDVATVARREEHAEDTRRALLSAARQAFARKGYAATSLEDIVGPARLTKGALYHHFKNKAAVLEALYIEMEEELLAKVSQAAEAAGSDPWARIVAVLEGFFAASAEPDYVRIVLRDAPQVLGRLHGREIDHAIGLGFVGELVTELCAGGLLPPLPVAATARMLLAVTSDIAVTMAYAADPELARREGTEAVLAVLTGLRSLARSG